MHFTRLLGIRPLDPAPLRGLREAFAAWSDLHRRGYELDRSWSSVITATIPRSTGR